MKSRLILFGCCVAAALALMSQRSRVFRQEFRYAGTVEVVNVEVPARFSTTIRKILVQEGDSVHADQLVAELYCDGSSDAKCKSYSPIDGIVRARFHEPGEWVAAGSPILTVAEQGSAYAYVYVPETILFKLIPGATVSAFLPEASDKPRKARIAFIRPEAEFTPKNVQTRHERTRLVFGVKLLLDNADRLLKAGMPIEVELPR